MYGDQPMRIDGRWHRNDDIAMGPKGQFQMYDARGRGGAHLDRRLRAGWRVAIPSLGAGHLRRRHLRSRQMPAGLTVTPIEFSPNRERCVDANGHSPLESAEEAGFILAHEAGHSHYNLEDEYFLDTAKPALYGFRICSNAPDWHTSVMGTRAGISGATSTRTLRRASSPPRTPA